MNPSLQPLPHWLPAPVPAQTPGRRQLREVGEAREDETRKLKQTQHPEGFHGTSTIHHQAPISIHCSAHYPSGGHPAGFLHLQPKNITCPHNKILFRAHLTYPGWTNQVILVISRSKQSLGNLMEVWKEKSFFHLNEGGAKWHQLNRCLRC